MKNGSMFQYRKSNIIDIILTSNISNMIAGFKCSYIQNFKKNNNSNLKKESKHFEYGFLSLEGLKHLEYYNSNLQLIGMINAE